MKNQKPTELSKKKKAYMQNFLAWLLEQPENIVYNITNKLGEFKMKQKKTKVVTLEMIYGELIEFKITQQAWNKKQEIFNDEVREFMVRTDNRLDNLEKDVKVLKSDMIEVKKDIAAIKECPTIKKELKKN